MTTHNLPLIYLHSYSTFEAPLVDLEPMDDYDQPPKKKTTGSLIRKESSTDSLNYTSFRKTEGELSTDSLTATACLTAQSASALSQRLLGTEKIPLMSKLSMNIGYARHLASTSSSSPNNDVQNPQYPGGGQSGLDSPHHSFNLLSKSSSTPGTGPLMYGNTSHISNQQAYYDGVREARQQPACLQDYPPQSQQLNSMYACGTNSSSINDFKLLINQTCTNDFSNGNDGGIWQPQLKSHMSSSSSASSLAGSHLGQGDIDLELYNYDDIPSFDEAMDMMASRP